MTGRRRTDERGIVLIMALVVLAVLAVVATAFIVAIRQEAAATRNALYGEQAAMSARAALAHAVRQIDAARALYGGPNAALGPAGARVLDNGNPGLPTYMDQQGWHSPFTGTGPGSLELSNPAAWLDPYVGERFAPGGSSFPAGLRGRKFPLVADGRKVGEYAVAVTDLDGRIHVFPANFGAVDLGPPEAEEMLKQAGVPPSAAAELAVHPSASSAVYSLGEIDVASGLTFSWQLRNNTEELVTVYPVGDPENTDPNLQILRPAVNVNTARKRVLDALIQRVPGLEGATNAIRTTVVERLVRNRPFSGRRHLEAVLADLAPSPVGDGTLGERQFNDLLNSLNDLDGSVFEQSGSFVNDSPPTDPPDGIYAFRFDPDLTITGGPKEQTPPNPTWTVFQDGGDATYSADNVTWSTELKFRSQYFHIFCIGQAIDSSLRPRATRRAHAVYDADVKRIVYFRHNFTEYGNLGDL